MPGFTSDADTLDYEIDGNELTFGLFITYTKRWPYARAHRREGWPGEAGGA